MQVPSPTSVLQVTLPILALLVLLNIGLSFSSFTTAPEVVSIASNAPASPAPELSKFKLKQSGTLPTFKASVSSPSPSPTAPRTLEQMFSQNIFSMLSNESMFLSNESTPAAIESDTFERDYGDGDRPSIPHLSSVVVEELPANHTLPAISEALLPEALASASDSANATTTTKVKAAPATAVSAGTHHRPATTANQTWSVRAVHECRPVAMKVITAGGADLYEPGVQRTCAFPTTTEDLVVGIWHSVKTAPRLRWVLDSWHSTSNVVFLGDKNESESCLPNLYGTHAGADDFLSTLHKGLVGLQMMFDAHPKKKWFIILGDDVYVDLPNLAEILSAFDSEQPHCLSEGGFQDRNWYSGFRLNGGAGIMTSRKLTEGVYDSMRRVADYFTRERKKLADEKEVHGIVTRWMQRHFFSMHDLVFANISWAHGFNVSHVEGIYSQNVRFYMPGSKNLMPGKDAVQERRLGQLNLRNYTLNSKLYPFPGTFHYISGPFQPWLHTVFLATRQCVVTTDHRNKTDLGATDETAEIERTHGDGAVAVGTFYSSGEKPRKPASSHAFLSVNLEWQVDGNYSKVLPTLLSNDKTQWILLVPSDVEIVPSNVRTLVSDATRLGYTFVADAKSRTAWSCLIRREVLQAALQDGSPKKKRVEDDDGPVAWLRGLLKSIGIRPTPFKGFVESVRERGEWDFGQCIVTVPLLLPSTTTTFYQQELDYICGRKAGKREVPTSLCKGSTTKISKADLSKKEKNLYGRFPCKEIDQLQILRSLLSPKSEEIERRLNISRLIQNSMNFSGVETDKKIAAEFIADRQRANNHAKFKGLEFSVPQKTGPCPTTSPRPTISTAPSPNPTLVPTSLPSLSLSPSPVPTNFTVPVPAAKTKNRQKPWYRKSNGPIGNEAAVSRLGRLTTEVQKLYAGNANILRFIDNEKDPERKEIKARQLIAAKRKERNSATATATGVFRSIWQISEGN